MANERPNDLAMHQDERRPAGNASAAPLSRRRFGLLTLGASFVGALIGLPAGASTELQVRPHPGARPVDLYRQLIERGFNRGDLTIADEICAGHVEEHQYLMPRDRPGPESMKNDITLTRQTVKQLSIVVQDFVEDGEKLWVRTHVTGFEASSGKPIAFDVIDICRFKDGKIVEHWGIPDRFAMLHQAGLLPPALM